MAPNHSMYMLIAEGTQGLRYLEWGGHLHLGGQVKGSLFPIIYNFCLNADKTLVNQLYRYMGLTGIQGKER